MKHSEVEAHLQSATNSTPSEAHDFQLQLRALQAELDEAKKELAREAADGKKKKSHHKRGGRLLGQPKPWSPVEDALLCAIVHEFGSNWGLITDVFAASAPFKGTYRRAEQCRWRFQRLTRSAEEGGDPAASAALNLDKGTARQTMSRALPVEDNTARVHFDRAAQAQARHAKARRLAAAERAGDDASRRAPPHLSLIHI